MVDPIHLLTRGRTPPTWSILVTIFGDMALEEGQSLSGGDLAALTGPLGIRPEALRTALHRLRRDDWIESHRDGRQMQHSLTASGRAESRAAAPRIYGTALPSDLFVILTDPDLPTPEGCTPVGPGLALASTATAFALPIEMPPGWMQHVICPPSLFADMDAVADQFSALTGPIDPDLAAPLRVLIVDRWRRVALRMPFLPPRAFPPGWRGEEARIALQVLLSRLPRARYSTSSISRP